MRSNSPAVYISTTKPASGSCSPHLTTALTTQRAPTSLPVICRAVSLPRLPRALDVAHVLTRCPRVDAFGARQRLFPQVTLISFSGEPQPIELDRPAADLRVLRELGAEYDNVVVV